LAEQEKQPSPSRRRRRRRAGLNNLSLVRAELAHLYRDGREGILDSLVAARLATILTAISRILEGEALEQRVAKIEQRLRRDGDPA
jgi:hypothetical protein